MKLTKKTEGEIMQVYEAYWAEYLNGNVDGMVPLLDASYTQVGSAEGEVFSTKKEAVQFLVDTIDQVAGKLEMRNRSTKLEEKNQLILVHEICDLYALADKKWTFYSKFRATTLLTEKKEGWKIIHQHSSFPDSKTEEGQNVAIDKIAEENRELREAVKRRTIELEQKNRELEIETALEKVRAKSMAMNKSEELADLSFELVKQVQALGVPTWFCAFNIYDDDPKGSIEWGSNGKGVFPNYRTPREGIFLRYYKAGQREESLLINEIGEKECPGHYEYLCTLPGVGEQLLKMKEAGIPFPTSQIDHVAFFKYGYILFITYEPAPEAHEIFKRFAKVFEQTYTRFLDLQKAEAQTREAQIEAALERVRSRSMAMHSSSELVEASDVMLAELKKLDIHALRIGICTIDRETEAAEIWSRSEINGKVEKTILGVVPKGVHPIFDNMVKAWKEKQPSFSSTRTGIEVKKYYEALSPYLSYPLPETYNEHEAISAFFFPEGSLNVVSIETLQKEEEQIMLRFANVFGQIYRRFLDLQKAETQAKEAQIEAALERVRSRSMGMHNSKELKNVIKVIFDQLSHLSINAEHAGIVVDYKPKKDWHFWIAETQDIPSKVTVPYLDLVWDRQFTEAKKEGKHFFTTQLDFDEKNNFYKELLPHIEGLTKKARDFYFNCPGLAASTAIQKNIGLYIENFSGTPYSEEENDILKRFAQVFDQTYTRFLDLKKAEAQAREAQIENALEKVRSRTMAMQKGEEVKDVVVLLYKELIALGVDNFVTCGYVEINEKINRQYTWVTSPGGDSLGLFYLPLTGDATFDERYAAWKKQQIIFHQKVAGEVRTKHLEYAITTFNSKEAEEMVRSQFPDPCVFYCFNFSHGYLHLVTGSQLNNEEESLLARFTRVFEQTYARFLDLKKAEAQAREAQIENALEKVRSRSLAMHKPEELQEVITVVAEKLQELGVIFDVGGVILCTYFPDNKDVMHWIASPDFSSLQSYLVPYFDNPIFNEAWDSKNRGDAYFSKEFPVEAKNSFFEYAFEHSDYRHFPDDYKQHVLEAEKHTLTAAWSKNSAIIIPSLTGVVPSESDADIMKRFAKVFEQAYIRFMDLQKAEAQAREAQIETALEKVRSRTMAMQHSDELPEAANNLFLQVQALGISAWSAGYCIWEEDQKSAYCNMSSEGEIQKGFSLPSIGEGYNFYDPYKKGETFHVSELGGKELVKHYDFMKTLPTVGEIFNELINSGISLPTFQIFHIVYFKFGYVMFITYEAVPDAHHIFKRFGQVFEQTYTRFLDLKLKEDQAVKLEEEKRRLEKTLKDLQETQKQLIQSEKMASLGELTAGIAHEIQNPLNFVNNFSEVSSELIEEMNEEIEKGDLEEAKVIANDVKQNLEKILHHGKRADEIVKGMLQHSRTSSGVKEPTDINALADEYLRLAYHGLRAKDNSFNATMKTEFDETIDNIKIIPQDIGRVILNLITNAFYVVDEKKKQLQNGYEPTISVSTKKINGKVEIKVTDNGNGIPKKVLAKIFQPFFTTKPTGQGTGLGLSLSYDIVKAHGGEISVKSKIGEGTAFTILLPV